MISSINYTNSDKNEWMLVDWVLGTHCNYSCSYCPSFLHDGKYKFHSFEKSKRVIDQIKSKTNKQVCFRFTGGEPTVCKHFLDLGQYIKDQGYYFSFLTNGSREIAYWQKMKNITDGFFLSFHPEFANIDHVIEVIQTVDPVPVVFNLLLVPEKWDDLLDYAERVFHETENCTIWPKTILDKTDKKDNSPLDYTADQLNVIRAWPLTKELNFQNLHRGDIIADGKTIDGNQLILDNMNSFSGWKCWAGSHSLCINESGEIWGATCKQGKQLGHIDTGITTWVDKPIICQKQICACLSDIYIKKTKE